MVFNTFTVASAVTPSVIETWVSHYLNRRPLRQKPTAHISYHEGLKLIRQFLEYSSKHPVEDLQAFTAQWVPVPTWVRTQDVEVPPQFLTRSANILRKQLGSNGIERVGGEKWWQWRRPESPLHAEWIEMKKDHNERKRAGVKCDRVVLYIHGGAYYFGSVDEHRYQMQRHARKLKARLLAPRYRLAPQFPFPCGLHDCIATYFYLLEHFDPTQVLFAGDSAGGGMVIAMLTVLRDQGCPLPAGTILLSPWVDLSHSFPSVAGDGVGDYIPPTGFHHKPSLAWPPPPTTEAKAQKTERKFTQPVEQPFDVVELPATFDSTAIISQPSQDNLQAEVASDSTKPSSQNLDALPGMGEKLALMIDDKLIEIREQFQMYAKNDLLTHPLVSPVQQPSLGGLPPMLIQVGGGELLRDEQIYLAHKAANPKAYPPSNAILDEYDPERTILNLYPPTNVQLQVWEDLCHVPHTLSFTRPAKYMYRSVAQFGAWALARAQNKSIEIMDDDAISIISDGSDAEKGEKAGGVERANTFGSIGMDGVTSTQIKLQSIGAVGKAGDELPPFKDNMIRQRVNRHGIVFPLPHRSEIASLHLDPETIGAIKPGPVRKWLTKRAENEQKFANEYKKVVKKKVKEMKDGYDKPEAGENPPPTALYNRRRGGVAPEQKKRGKSWGLAMWSGWGSSHDENTIQREEKIINEREEEEAENAKKGSEAAGIAAPEDDIAQTEIGKSSNLAVPGREANAEAQTGRRQSASSMLSNPWSRKERDGSRPRSPYKQVKDAGQTGSERDNSGVSPISPISTDNDTIGNRQSRWDFSRRSSGTSVKSRAGQPVSVAAVPPSPTFMLAPTISDTGKEAVKVPGTDNTYLNPDSSRPHNGIVAFPFKLGKDQQTVAQGRSQSPNPSTMTLDSNEGDGELVSEGLFGGQMPSFSTTAVEMPGSPVKIDGAPVEHLPGTQDLAASETLLANKPAVIGATSVSDAGAFDGVRPVSSIEPSGAALAHLQSPEQDPVSPIDPPAPSFETTTTASSSVRHNKFESRDSRLGFLGADGMPTFAFPERIEQDKTMAADDITNAAPFKIRNPVVDPRVVAGQASSSDVPPSPPPQQQQPYGNTADAVKAAPFKMRHIVYSTATGQPSGEKAPATGAADKKDVNPPTSDFPVAPTVVPTQSSVSSPTNDALPPRSDASSESTLPGAADAPNSGLGNIDSERPPPPVPPKDEPSAVDVETTDSVGRKPFLPSSTPNATSIPKTVISSSTPPTIGDLIFEFELKNPAEGVEASVRPPLESFVTASEGLDKKTLGGEAI